MEIKTTVSLTEKDAINFSFCFAKKRIIFLPIWIYITAVCIVLIKIHPIDTFTLCIMMLWVLLFTLLEIFLVRWGARRGWKNNALLRETTDYTFSDTGIHVVTSTGMMNVSYDKLFKIHETPTVFYVYLAPRVAWIIPKRCFDSMEDVQAARELFRKNMPPKKARLMKTS